MAKGPARRPPDWPRAPSVRIDADRRRPNVSSPLARPTACRRRGYEGMGGPSGLF